MGREARRVPKNWKHPKDDNDNYIPLYGWSFSKSLADWDEGKIMWEKGLRQKFSAEESKELWITKKKDENGSWEGWTGARPEKKDYMPDWDETEKTHLQMYEDCSEGTPISPVMATPEELAHWLADNKASSFGQMTANYEAWLRVCQGGWAPGMILTVTDSEKTLTSGVEGLKD